jgi:hypothetical protein
LGRAVAKSEKQSQGLLRGVILRDYFNAMCKKTHIATSTEPMTFYNLMALALFSPVVAQWPILITPPIRKKSIVLRK